MTVSGVLRRYFAWLIDSIILAGLTFGLTMFLEALGVGVPLNELVQAMIRKTEQSLEVINSFQLEVWAIYAVLFFIYEIVFVASSLSATPGKIILGIEIVSDRKSSIDKVIIRALVKFIGEMFPFSLVNFIMVLVSGKKQSLHDKAARTYVVYKKVENNYSKKIDPKELFEEMKRRGLRTYSEQLALAEELYGKNRKKARTSASYGWISLVLLIVGLVLFGVFFSRYLSIYREIYTDAFIRDYIHYN